MCSVVIVNNILMYFLAVGVCFQQTIGVTIKLLLYLK